MKTVCTCFLSLVSTSGVFTKGSDQGAVASGFFIPDDSDCTGAITQPSMRLKRPIRINVANLACVSWVSIPRGRENWSSQQGSTPMTVSLDKRELLSLVDNLPTACCSGA